MRLITAAWPLRHGRRSVLLVALVTNLLLAVTFGAKRAHACTCSSGTPEERLQKSEAVFSGVVIDEGEMSMFGGFGLSTFDVEESWKGVSEDQVTVNDRADSSPRSFSSCDFNFREGQRYLIFAHGEQGPAGPLSTDVCDGTKPLSNAEADLEALGPAELVLPERIDSAPVSSTWGILERVVAGAAVMLLALAAVGGLFFLRRRRRPG